MHVRLLHMSMSLLFHTPHSTQVSLQFGESFYLSHLPAMVYHVRFNVPRTNFRLMHEAVCVIGASNMAAGTLLPATRPPQGGWIPYLKSAGASVSLDMGVEVEMS